MPANRGPKFNSGLAGEEIARRTPDLECVRRHANANGELILHCDCPGASSVFAIYDYHEKALLLACCLCEKLAWKIKVAD